MIKKIIISVLIVLMLLGISIAVSNFLSIKSNAEPCKQVAYHPTIPDCSGPGTTCWDCTQIKPRI